MSLEDANIDHDQVYTEVNKIYDLAEDIIDAIETEGVVNPEEQLAIAERVIEQAGESGDEISEAYIDYAEADFSSNGNEATRIQAAIRKIFSSIADFDENVSSLESENDDETNMITIDDLKKKMKLIQILGEGLPESKIQNSLRAQAIRLGMRHGGLLVVAIKRLGDHTLGLMHVFQSLGLGKVLSTIPNRSGWKLMGAAKDVKIAAPVIKQSGPGI